MRKSLCFEALTYTNSLLHVSSCNKDIVFLVAPLKLLTDMQKDKLNGLGLAAVSLGEADKQVLQDLEDGRIRR